MQRGFWMGLGSGLGLGAMLLAALQFFTDEAAAVQGKPKGSAIAENDGGSVPKTWGDFIGVAGQKGTLTLAFKSTEDGTIRLLDVGAKVGATAVRIVRD